MTVIAGINPPDLREFIRDAVLKSDGSQDLLAVSDIVADLLEKVRNARKLFLTKKLRSEC